MIRGGIFCLFRNRGYDLKTSAKFPSDKFTKSLFLAIYLTLCWLGLQNKIWLFNSSKGLHSWFRYLIYTLVKNICLKYVLNPGNVAINYQVLKFSVNLLANVFTHKNSGFPIFFSTSGDDIDNIFRAGLKPIGSIAPNWLLREPQIKCNLVTRMHFLRAYFDCSEFYHTDIKSILDFFFTYL